jgi:hypothetical protein
VIVNQNQLGYAYQTKLVGRQRGSKMSVGASHLNLQIRDHSGDLYDGTFASNPVSGESH